MTTPLTASVTKPEVPPEPVRPRLTAILCWMEDIGWQVNEMPKADPSCWNQQTGYRIVTIPADAEAAHDAGRSTS